ncbi:MAG: hypothetical protein GY924_17920 [Planctomycetaceae bacterium]|nr:hypothetical protein [Planctomycetaceae bacterium]
MPDRFTQVDAPVQPYKRPDQAVRNDSISNNTIVIAAILCLGGLIFVIATTLVISKVFYEPPSALTEAEEAKTETPKAPVVTEFKEGYSMILPSGFGRQTRRETAAGDTVYTFTGENGCKLTFALINDDSLDRFSSPPKTYPASLIQHIPELSTGIDGEVAPERVTVGGMPTVLFRFYEKETYRGVVFTYYMVSLDRGKKLALKVAGKHGNYSEGDSNINMPDHWYDAMLTLKRTGRAR